MMPRGRSHNPPDRRDAHISAISGRNRAATQSEAGLTRVSYQCLWKFMATFLAFIGLLLLVLGGMHLAFLRSFLFWFGYGIFLFISFLCRLTSITVDFFLSPQGIGRTIIWQKYSMWVFISTLPLIFFVLAPKILPAILKYIEPGYLLIFAALFHVMVLTSALIIIYEDYDIMDGVIAADRRKIRGSYSAKRLPTIIISTIMFILYSATIIFWLSDVEMIDMFDKRPHTGLIFVDYFLIVMWSLPSDIVLRLSDWIVGGDTQVLFNFTPVARAVYFTIYGIGSILLLGLISMVVQQAWLLQRIISQLGQMHGEQHKFLIERARRAPDVVKRRIVNAALNSSDKSQQRGLMIAAVEIGIFTFPQTLCYNIRTFQEDIQKFGLDQAIKFVRQRGADFSREQSEATLRNAAFQLRRGKLSAETTKRMLRLMIEVLNPARGVVKPGDDLRQKLSWGISKELGRSKAKADSELKDLLQQLRKMIVGPEKSEGHVNSTGKNK
jgi:hypothetical protein